MKSRKILFVFYFVFMCSTVYALELANIFDNPPSPSNANTPSGGKAKPSQTSIKVGAGGDSSSSGATRFEPYTDSESIPGSLGMDTEKLSTNYIGVWLRQALYINGKLEHQTPATLTYKKDSFSAIGTCSTAGTIEVFDNTIKTVMTQSDCPGGVKPPLTIVYNFKITEDGKKLILTAGPVKEVYIRKK